MWPITAGRFRDFWKVKELVESGAIGEVRMVNVRFYRPINGDLDKDSIPWRFQPEISGGGLIFDLAAHTLDYLDYVFGPVLNVKANAMNQAERYPAEDIVLANWQHESGVAGTGSWCFTTSSVNNLDEIEIIGNKGRILFSTFEFIPVVLENEIGRQEFPFEKPSHVQFYLMEKIIAALRGEDKSPSTGETAARTNRVLDEMVRDYYNKPNNPHTSNHHINKSTHQMKVVIDDKIPYIKGALEPFAEVVYLPGSKTTPEIVRDADAIITRTRTKCNESLLSESSVRFIATATIGFDHIDTRYCDKAGITWTNAPGCNSSSVEQYIASALMVLSEKKGFNLADKTIGIIGVGNVGSKVARIAEIFGMKVLLNDPPRAKKEGPEAFTDLEEILEKADIITLHVPLNPEGIDKTYHLADQTFFNRLKKQPIVINSCRGEVTETYAFKEALKSGKISGAVIDCWENEPNIDLELLGLSNLATPHIAGYSKDGKANGTSMSIQALSRFFGLGIDDWTCKNVELPQTTAIMIDGNNKSGQQILKEAVLATYDIREDDHRLRGSVETFEKQRGDYPLRREFPVYTITAKNIDKNSIQKLEKLGFIIKA